MATGKLSRENIGGGRVKIPARMAIVKVAWSDDYRGMPVDGNFDFIKKYKEGHERLNFEPVDGRYLGYAIWTRSGNPPAPKTQPDGWLVVFVAKRPKEDGLYIVGWYEDATFTGKYLERPDADRIGATEPDGKGDPFLYCMTATRAIAVPEALRTFKFSNVHVRSAKIVWLSGNDGKGAWRSSLANMLLEGMKGLGSGMPGDTPTPKPPKPPWPAFGTSAENREVEIAAENAAEAALVAKGYKVVRRGHEKCGYDLLATKPNGDALHVEVKGTRTSTRQFLMSRNEFRYSVAPLWRLAMVTDALDVARVEILTLKQAQRIFEWEPFTWQGREKI